MSRPTRGIDDRKSLKFRAGSDGRILVVPGDELRAVPQRPVDNLVKTRLGVLKFPGVHCCDPSSRRTLVSARQQRKAAHALGYGEHALPCCRR
jgi:hypothetical protein